MFTYLVNAALNYELVYIYYIFNTRHTFREICKCVSRRQQNYTDVLLFVKISKADLMAVFLDSLKNAWKTIPVTRDEPIYLLS